MGLNLNLGCGEDVRPGHLNCDARSLDGVDVVCDASRLPFRDNSFEAVLGLDLLEHFSWRRTVEVLEEWRRVLKPDGVLELKVPNLHTLMAAYMQGKIPFQEFVRIAYGHQDYPENTHRAGFQPEFLKYLLENHGFNVKEIEESMQGGDWKNMWIVAAVKDDSSPPWAW